MERRVFVKLSAFTALALSVPFAEGCAHKSEPLALPLLFSHFADKNTITQTGLAYRKMFENENSQSALGEVLSANGPTMDADALRLALAKQVKQDFVMGKIVTVDGWVLSVTEARQCALFSIVNA
ncbi:MAG: hypothetical protein ACXVIY_02405 [Mucilaginibacter sp.]